MSKPVFFDPDRRRWKRIRKSIDVTVVVLSLLIVFFALTVVRKTNIPTVLLADQKKNYRALKLSEPKKPLHKSSRRKTLTPASQVVLNSGEGIRGAFYVTWDAASFSSLREYIHQIDFVFPGWLQVLGPDGRLQAVNENNELYYVINSTNAQVDVLPLVNNFDPIVNEWRSDIAQMLDSQQGREHFRQELGTFLASDNYKGLTLDIEGFPQEAQPGYRALIAELASDLHQHNQKLYLSGLVHAEPGQSAQSGSSRKDHLRHRQLRIRLDDGQEGKAGDGRRSQRERAGGLAGGARFGGGDQLRLRPAESALHLSGWRQQPP